MNVFILKICEYEYGDNTLQQAIKERKIEFNEEECLQLFVQIVCGVLYIHKKKIIHRNIKPSNIVVTKQNIVKISDFGVSCVMDISSNSQLSYQYWNPPLYVSGNVYRKKVRHPDWPVVVWLHFVWDVYFPSAVSSGWLLLTCDQDLQRNHRPHSSPVLSRCDRSHQSDVESWSNLTWSWHQVRSGPIGSDQFRSDQIRSDWIWSQIRSGQVRSGASWSQIMSDQIRSDEKGSS